MGYFNDTLKGIKWMSVFKAINHILSFLRIAIIAHILTPVQFGVFAIASLCLSFLETITETGIGVFLIQEKKDTKMYLDSAWMISIARGVVIFIVIFFGAGTISRFFNSPESFVLIRVVAFVALVRGFISPSRVNFIKDLNFRGEFLISFIVLSVDMLVTITSTIILRNPIALIYGLLFGAITEVVLSFIMLTPRPRLNFDRKISKNIIGAGKWVTASTIFNYLFSEGDDVLVGKILSKFDLGIYQVSYKIATLPLTEITQVINGVVFPVYVQIREDVIRLRKAFYKTLMVIVLTTVPLCALIYVFPKIIVTILLGNSWYDAIVYIQLLALFGLFRSFTVACNPIFNAVKKQKYITYYSFASFVLMIITIFPLMNKYGLKGTIYSVLLGSALSLFINIVNVYKIIK